MEASYKAQHKIYKKNLYPKAKFNYIYIYMFVNKIN